MSIYRVRDPIHGFIYFTKEEKIVIDWPEFQRLRNIRQLALTSFVYPGAMHSRFEHSLGVMEIASKIFERIYRKKPDLIKNSLEKAGLTIDQGRNILRLSALLHDIGHLPFSHGGEAILPPGVKHEDVSVAIINNLKDRIDKLYFKCASEVVIQLIKGDVIPELKFLKDILSGQVDADRMDYLLRDSLHCGVDYGYFDYRRLIEELNIYQDITDGIELSIDRGGIHSLEALILARYYMFTQVYCHRTRRIYDIYLKNFMSKWNLDLTSLINTLTIDDIDLMNEIRVTLRAKEQGGEIDELKFYWAYRICNRIHHSVIYETSDFADAEQRRKATGIYKKLEENHPEFNFILDMDAKGSIHKFFVRGEDEEGIEFYVLHKYGKDLVTDESKIIAGMKKNFHVVRIYVDTKDPSIQKSLRDKALDYYREVR